MCLTGVSGMHSPATICSTCAQKAPGIGGPAGICSKRVKQERLECTALPTFASHVLRNLLELGAPLAFATAVITREDKFTKIIYCKKTMQNTRVLRGFPSLALLVLNFFKVTTVSQF